MLWKLADNVKYEDDCEVSGTEQRKLNKTKSLTLSQDLKKDFYFDLFYYYYYYFYGIPMIKIT